MKDKILLILGILGIILLAGCAQPTNTSPTTTNKTTEGTGITKTMCEQYKGNWDGAKSVCNCGGIAGFACPPSYVCGDYSPSKDTPDAMGICKKVSE